MGKDGAQGLLAMKQAGATTFAQDEASCVVFGMPREALHIEAADSAVPLSEMSERILASAGSSGHRVGFLRLIDGFIIFWRVLSVTKTHSTPGRSVFPALVSHHPATA